MGENAQKPQLTERQSKALLAELSPKLREELCHVLRQQQNGEERVTMSRELSRVLQRFQYRAGMKGRQDSGDETWPMYLGIALFIVISILFAYIGVQEQYGLAEEEMEEEQDLFW